MNEAKVRWLDIHPLSEDKHHEQSRRFAAISANASREESFRTKSDRRSALICANRAKWVICASPSNALIAASFRQNRATTRNLLIGFDSGCPLVIVRSALFVCGGLLTFVEPRYVCAYYMASFYKC